MVERIACFFTGGYTEAGGMQAFLEKINGKYEFKQYMPNKTKKRKGDAKVIQKELSGVTGEIFLRKVYDILENEKCRNEISQCKAILLADDLDGRFHGWSNEQVNAYKQTVIEKICQKLQKEMPVFFLYASPEIESWFVADWNNGFEAFITKSGFVSDVEVKAKQFFAHSLKIYVQDNILKEYCLEIEEYGFRNGKYYKLSDQLIEAVQTKVKESMIHISGVNKEYLKQIQESRELYYSKKGRGEWMLKNINPEIVAQECKRYFRPVYNEILDF